MNFVRYGSDGSDFASRVRLIKAVVEMLSEKEGKDWILSLKGLVSAYVHCPYGSNTTSKTNEHIGK